MFRPRNLLTMLALVALVGITIGATVQVVAFGPKMEPPVTHERLCAWLVDPQGQQLPRSEKKRLALRLECDLTQMPEWSRSLQTYPAEVRPTAIDNLYHLLGILIVDRAEHYFRLPENQQQAWAEQQLSVVMQWAIPSRMDRSVRTPARLRTADLNRIVEHAEQVNEGRLAPEYFQQAKAALLTIRVMRDFDQVFPRRP